MDEEKLDVGGKHAIEPLALEAALRLSLASFNLFGAKIC